MLLVAASAEFASDSAINKLSTSEKKVYEPLRKDKVFSNQYQERYVKTLEYVALFLPSRKDDFIILYTKKDADKRKSLNSTNYGIQDPFLVILVERYLKNN